jgi:hypothetical protein
MSITSRLPAGAKVSSALFPVLLLLGSASEAATAKDSVIHKCQETDGGVVYQLEACPRGKQLGSLPRDRSQPSNAAVTQMRQEWQDMQRAGAQRRQQEAAFEAASLNGQMQSYPMQDTMEHTHGWSDDYWPPLYYGGGYGYGWPPYNNFNNGFRFRQHFGKPHPTPHAQLGRLPGFHQGQRIAIQNLRHGSSFYGTKR